MTITEFLLARIAEDESSAHECARIFPPPWEIADRGWRVRIYSANVPLSEDVGDPGDERVPCVIEVEPTYAHDGWLSDNVEHIARHDPARVLAECEAKRRIVGRCQPITLPEGAPEMAAAAWDGINVLNAATLRDLASVHADHPDYDEGWRV